MDTLVEYRLLPIDAAMTISPYRVNDLFNAQTPRGFETVKADVVADNVMRLQAEPDGQGDTHWYKDPHEFIFPKSMSVLLMMYPKISRLHAERLWKLSHQVGGLQDVGGQLLQCIEESHDWLDKLGVVRQLWTPEGLLTSNGIDQVTIESLLRYVEEKKGGPVGYRVRTDFDFSDTDRMVVSSRHIVQTDGDYETLIPEHGIKTASISDPVKSGLAKEVDELETFLPLRYVYLALGNALNGRRPPGLMGYSRPETVVEDTRALPTIVLTDLLRTSSEFPNPSIAGEVRFKTVEQVEKLMDQWGIPYKTITYSKGKAVITSPIEAYEDQPQIAVTVERPDEQVREFSLLNWTLPDGAGEQEAHFMRAVFNDKTGATKIYNLEHASSDAEAEVKRLITPDERRVLRPTRLVHDLDFTALVELVSGNANEVVIDGVALPLTSEDRAALTAYVDEKRSGLIGNIPKTARLEFAHKQKSEFSFIGVDKTTGPSLLPPDEPIDFRGRA